MRYLIVGVALAIAATPVAADTWVDGYARDDGTRVQGHMRSDPNGYEFDNYSAEGNTNPYTGESGSKSHEFSTPSSDGLDSGSDYGSGYDSGYGNDGLYD